VHPPPSDVSARGGRHLQCRMRKKPETIDEYLASLKPDRRAALEKLRRMSHSVVPDAEECISYSMPAFRYKGHVIAGFLSTAKGCSYFPFSGTTLSTLSSDLAAYRRTKSALHFDPKRPLPVSLVRKLLRARIAETTTREKHS
jgi:uncharacterized protein YdhG (YjbR/CyaY superfamily)